MSEWILCKDKLPEDGVMVWVTIAGSDIVCPMEGETLAECLNRQHKEIRRVELGFYSEKWDDVKDWYSYDGFPMIVKPIAWKPFHKPEAYNDSADLFTADEIKELDEAFKNAAEAEPFD